MKRGLLMVALMLFAGSALAWDKSKARIIQSVDRPAQCISSVKVYQIDGREVLLDSKLGFEIEPGNHELRARGVVNMSHCGKIVGGSSRTQQQPLEMNFEAGKTYYIGLDTDAPHRRDWKLVVWKTESAEVDGQIQSTQQGD